jgi:hypothetical protein
MRPGERDGVHAMLAAHQQYAEVLPPEVFERYLASVLDTDEGHQLVAVDGEEDPRRLAAVPARLADRPTATGLGVGAGRGRGTRRPGAGVAREIMAHRAENAGGATALALHTVDFMRAAIRLYEWLGHERAPEYGFLAGRGAFTAIAYRLPLR